MSELAWNKSKKSNTWSWNWDWMVMLLIPGVIRSRQVSAAVKWGVASCFSSDMNLKISNFFLFRRTTAHLPFYLLLLGQMIKSWDWPTSDPGNTQRCVFKQHTRTRMDQIFGSCFMMKSKMCESDWMWSGGWSWVRWTGSAFCRRFGSTNWTRHAHVTNTEQLAKPRNLKSSSCASTTNTKDTFVW